MSKFVVQIPWYATLLRGDDLESALEEIAHIARRYEAESYHVYRSNEDRYSFLQVVTFPSKLDFERYWSGKEFTDFRASCSGWYQVPVLYSSHELVTSSS